MKQLIAKTKVGKEFLHSKKDAFFCDRSAQRIADILNNNNYKLSSGEKWHVYDFDYTQDFYVTSKIYIASNGQVKAKAV